MNREFGVKVMKIAGYAKEKHMNELRKSVQLFAQYSALLVKHPNAEEIERVSLNAVNTLSSIINSNGNIETVVLAAEKSFRNIQRVLGDKRYTNIPYKSETNQQIVEVIKSLGNIAENYRTKIRYS
jgi:uncharacterized membrane protein affecting hemolysin expression